MFNFKHLDFSEKRETVFFNYVLVELCRKLLSDVFFEDLNIRRPDYNLSVGAMGKDHYHVSGEASIKAVELIRKIKVSSKKIRFRHAIEARRRILA